MAQTQQPQYRPGESGINSSGDDPLATLHKMSTTAGLGSTEYVAVNPTSIFTLILGFASALTLFGAAVLLVLPIVGIIAGVVSFRQIGRSNGTQTGRLLASAGMALAVAFCAVFGFRALAEYNADRRDADAIEQSITKLGEKLVAADYEGAYGLFSDRFHERITAQHFADVMRFIHENPTYGKLSKATWNRLAEFVVDEGTNTRLGTAVIILVFEKIPEIRQQAWFRKLPEGSWVLEDIPSLFPPPKKEVPGQ